MAKGIPAIGEPFCSVGHPATLRLLEQLLPGRAVRDFSLHFPMQGVVTLQAEILLNADDLEQLAAIAEEFELTVKPSDASRGNAHQDTSSGSLQ